MYFKEPGGVLFELATDGPGFAIDENSAHLGESLVLPPFLESQRTNIEHVLPPLKSPDEKNGPKLTSHTVVNFARQKPFPSCPWCPLC